MTGRVLFVDSDKNLLSSFKLVFRKDFAVTTAAGGKEALEKIDSDGPFAVVVSDFRMPYINGIELLAEVRDKSPDTLRIMLTGQADKDIPVCAINEANIYRFLNKPCSEDKLKNVLKNAIDQYELITAERSLLENTLNDVITVFTDVLSLTCPLAFSHSNLINKYANTIIENIDCKNTWKFQIATKLSQIGCVSLPNELLQKFFFDETLSPEETELFNNFAVTGMQLIQKIHKLGDVAKIIEHQLDPVPREEALENWSETQLGAQIIKTASSMAQYKKQGLSFAESKERLIKKKDEYHPKMIEALSKIDSSEDSEKIASVDIAELSTNMTFIEDIKAENGILLVPKGQPVTFLTIQRLKNFQKKMGIPENYKVKIS